MSKILKTIKSTHKDLDDTVERDRTNLYDSIRTLEKRIMSDLSALESKDGKLISPKVNLKQAQKIHTDMVKHFKETYEDTAYRVTKGYGKAAKRIKSMYRDLDISVEFTGVDADIIKGLQASSYKEYKAYGVTAQQNISKAMYNAVLTKGSYEDLVGSVSAVLTGHLSKSGKPMSSYADTWANDGLMNFHQTVATKKGNDAGLNTYLYVGNVMGTTRPFCIEHVMNVYTKKEIESWDYHWAGKSGPAMTNRGGWNCRHHWQPIKKEWVKDLEGEIAEDEEIQAELKVVKPERGVVEEEEVVKPELSWEDLMVEADNLPVEGGKVAARIEIQEAIRDSKNSHLVTWRDGEGQLRGAASYSFEKGNLLRIRRIGSMTKGAGNDMLEDLIDVAKDGGKTFTLDARLDIRKYWESRGFTLKEGTINVFEADPRDVVTSKSDVILDKEVTEETPEYQSFDKYLETADFDWEALDVDPDGITIIQRDMIKSRFEDAGNKISNEEADDIRVSIRDYTSELYTEYGEWVRNPELYSEGRERWQVNVMEDMDKNLRNYTDNTLPFNSTIPLYRGKKTMGALTGVAEGDEIDLNYLSSFSADRSVGMEFTEGSSDPVLMVINPGNAILGSSLAEFSESGYEKEVLLSDNNRLVCTSITEKDGVTYMNFDSVEVLKSDVVPEREIIKLEKELKEERVAKEEAERKLEELEKTVVVEEPTGGLVGFVEGTSQKFNKKFVKGGFDWESIEDDYEKIEKMQLGILKKRFKDGGISMPKVELEGVFESIQKYTKEDFKDFQTWAYDKSKYPDIPSLDRFRKIEKDMNMYINDTPSFDSKTPLYRGTSFEYYKDVNVGDTIEHEVFTSWTTDEDQSADFAMEETTEGVEVEDPVVLVINKGNQTYSSSVAEFSEFGHEREVLLSDRNKLVLRSTEEKDGVKYMYFDTEEVTVEELKVKDEKRSKVDEKLETVEAEKREEYKKLNEKQELLDELRIWSIEEAHAMMKDTYDWRKYYEEEIVWDKISDKEWKAEYVSQVEETRKTVKDILSGESKHG